MDERRVIKMQGGENIGNSSILEVPITQFSDSIQENLRKPIPNDSNSQEYDLLYEELALLGKIRNSETFMISDKVNPIFRTSRERTSDKYIFTRQIKTSNLTKFPEPEIFLIIDYNFLEDNFASKEKAQNLMNYWAKNTYENIKKFEDKAPKIRIKVVEENEVISTNPIKLYKKVSENRHGDDKAPKVVITCLTLENQLKILDSEEPLKPLYEVNLIPSIGENQSKNSLLSIIESIKNGIVIISKESSGIEILRKILEITCTIAVEYSYSSSDYLLSSFPITSFKSFQDFRDSKSCTLGDELDILDKKYKEMPCKNSITYWPLTKNFKNTRKGMYLHLEQYDKILTELKYKCNSRIRDCFEAIKKPLNEFEDKIFEIITGSTRRDFYKNMKRQGINPGPHGQIINNYFQSLLKNYSDSFNERQENSDESELDESKIGFQKTCKEIEKIFYSTLFRGVGRFQNDRDLFSNFYSVYKYIEDLVKNSEKCYKLACIFNHVGNRETTRDNEHLSSEDKELFSLNIDFNLALHLSLYEPLKRFLDYYSEKLRNILINEHPLIYEIIINVTNLEIKHDFGEEE